MIIADADFLSAFLKIHKTDLVFRALETDEIVITGAVLHEIERVSVYTELIKLINGKDRQIIIKTVECVQSEVLGKGELESINLAQKTNALLLMDDRFAEKYADNKGITVMTIPTFLLYCKTNNFISSGEMQNIIDELNEKDHYIFSAQTTRTLRG